MASDTTKRAAKAKPALSKAASGAKPGSAKAAAPRSPRGTAQAPARTGKQPSRKVPPSAREPSSPPRGVFSRVLGAVAFAAALYLGFRMLDPETKPPAVLSAWRSSLGAASGPAVVVVALLALLLVAGPRWYSSPRARRALGGGVLAFAALLLVLGAVGAGGALGNGGWTALAESLGLGAPLLLAVVAGIAVVLLGVPIRALLRSLAATVVGVGRVASGVLLWAIGCAVWVARLGGNDRRTPEPPLIVAPKAKAKGEAPIPGPVDSPPEPEPLQPPEPRLVRVREEPVSAGADRDWTLPPMSLLTASDVVEVSESDARRQARVIEETLATFGVTAHVREINPGPTVTQFAIEPGVGTKVSRITSLQNDLALSLAASSIRMEAPVPGQSRVGLEIPNGAAATVRLRDVMDSSAYHGSKGKLRLALGRDVTGRAVVGDLATMPHLLIAGATGSGKSACLNSIVTGFLFQHTPEALRFLMVDPKMVELKTYDGVPHLVWPVVTDVTKVVAVLKYAVQEMERRYKELSEIGVREIEAYNKRMVAEGQPKLPRVVIIIDELADLMMAAPEEVEALICRLAQLARAVGIHLILATQRPSVDVLTGLIKANFPSRIAFAVSSGIDSRVILDAPGAERLLGRGDMLFLGGNSPKPIRVQGAYVSDEEVEDVVAHWGKLQPPEYDPEVGRLLKREEEKSDNPKEDPLYQQALELAGTHGRLSASLLQRRLSIGYNRAARLMDTLRDNGDLDVELDA